MNLELPKKEKVSKKRIIMFVVIAIICIISITVVIGVQELGNDVIDNIFGITKITQRSAEEEATLKANFENIFDNTLEQPKKQNYQVQKIKETEDLVYTNYTKQDKTDKYEVDVSIPYININNNDAKKFNQDMEETFVGKAEDITKNNNQNTIYTVKYKANVEKDKDILSVAIYADLKQNTSAQRLIIQTFNYDLKENKVISLEETLNKYNIKKASAQSKINDDIKSEQKKADDLIDLGYNVYSRDLKSDIYKVENVSEYFIYNGNIYVIFAYGNDQITSTNDIVIL